MAFKSKLYHGMRTLLTLSRSSTHLVRNLPSFTVGDPIVKDTLPKTETFIVEKQPFLDLLPEIINSVTHDGAHKDVPSVNEHLETCIKYNVVNGKLNRGLMVPHTFKLLTDPPQHTDKNLKLANILGWCVELLQSFFLVADDIMDGSSTRRGQECWYKKAGVGMIAVNDGIMLETCIYTLLHQHFQNHPNYAGFLDAFIYTTRHTTMGQSLDLLSCYSQNSELRKCNLEDFNMKRYSSIVRYKTSYYSFYLPVQLGMGLAGVGDPELYRQARTILLEMGHFFQVQDDYLDCYGDPNVTGKVGTDIQDGKCSWLITVALQRATREQKEILKKNYGSSNTEDVEKVKSVYKDLNITQLYKRYEQETMRDLLDLINRMSGGSEKKTLNHQIFKSLLARIYRRDR